MRRYPFKLKQTPFLITHCGLLMIIAGALLKISHGQQGYIRLEEGQKTERFFMTDSYDLWLYQFGDFQFENPFIVPLKGVNNLKLQPSSQIHFRGFGKKSISYKAWMSGLGPSNNDSILKRNIVQEKNMVSYLSELKDIQGFFGRFEQALSIEQILAAIENSFSLVEIDPSTGNEIPIPKKDWGLSSHLDEAVENIFLSIKSKPNTQPIKLSQGPIYIISDDFFHTSLVKLKGNPLIFVFENQEQEHLVYISASGQITQQTFDNISYSNLFTYNFGFDGLNIELDLPLDNDNKDLSFNLSDSLGEVITEVSPHLYDNELFNILKSYCDQHNIELKSLLSPLLIQIVFPESSALSSTPWSTHLQIIRHLMPPSFCQGINSSAPLINYYKSIPLNTLHHHILSSPLANFISKKSASKRDILQSIIPPIVESSSLVSTQDQVDLITFYDIYLSYLGLTPSILLEEASRRSNNKFKSRAQRYTLKSALKLQVDEPKDSKDLVFYFDENGNDLILPFSESKHHFMTRVNNGHHLAKIDYHSYKLPFSIAVSKAYTDYLPDTQRPRNYFCNGRYESSSGFKEFTLSSNQVFETPEGYRLYLSAIDEPMHQPSQVQITINYDPFRYTLTYPGLILTVIGIIGLFVGIKENS